MTDTNNYIETDKEREEGHVDTRERNFECENKDHHLGCNLGIDVAAYLSASKWTTIVDRFVACYEFCALSFSEKNFEKQ